MENTNEEVLSTPAPQEVSEAIATDHVAEVTSEEVSGEQEEINN